MNQSLEFSANTKVSGQELLFQISPRIESKPTIAIPSQFYKQGFCVLDNIEDEVEAQTVLTKFIASISHPLYTQFLGNIQLAKKDLIPVCHDIIPRNFQALHFDMGQPILSDSTQSMYLLLALYRPLDSKEGVAKTRIVSIENLSKSFGKFKQVEQRLIEYALQYGDGWHEPNVVNTKRLACFARVLDAITGKNQLVDQIDNTTGQWFEYGEDASKSEQEFFEGVGIDLGKIEHQINVKPGQLLVVDNMRCVHGRIGPREEKEIWQFLYGVKSATPKMIDEYRKWLVLQFSTNHDESQQ